MQRRARMTFACVMGVAGSATGAVLEVKFGFWAIALPVVLSALAVPLGQVEESHRYDQKGRRDEHARRVRSPD